MIKNELTSGGLGTFVADVGWVVGLSSHTEGGHVSFVADVGWVVGLSSHTEGGHVSFVAEDVACLLEEVELPSELKDEQASGTGGGEQASGVVVEQASGTGGGEQASGVVVEQASGTGGDRELNLDVDSRIMITRTTAPKRSTAV
jgi:hypothetical protein